MNGPTSAARRRTEPRPPAQLVCVALSPSIDVTYLVPELVPNTIHRPTEVYRVPGGKGFNVARAAHTLGADVVATGVLGGDTGAWMVAMLARTGIRMAPVTGARPTRTCVSVADRATGGLTEFYEPPPLITPKAWSDLLATVARVCEEHPSWVSLSGSLPPGPVPEAIADLVAAAKGAGARVAVDTHSTALAAAVGAGADLLKVNVEEAAAVLGLGQGTGYPRADQDLSHTPAREHEPPGDREPPRDREPPSDREAPRGRLAPHHGQAPHAGEARRNREDQRAEAGDPAQLAAKLLAASPGTELAIVTAGADGAVLAARDGTGLHLRLDVRGEYPIGSGDSFLGGLLTALADHPEDLVAAARLAVGAGAANALTPGAGVLKAATARDLADRVVVTPITG